MEVKNGYFKLDIREMGAFLQIYPPENGGKQLEVKEVLEYLERKGYSGFQLKELNDAILSSTGTNVKEIYIGDGSGFDEDEEMEVTVSGDKMLVFCRFYAPSNKGSLMTEQDIVGVLSSQKVTSGIQQEAIQNFLKNRQYCTDFIFAKGTPPINGKDAKIEYLFNTNHNLRPKKNEDGTVDYRELNTISHVEKGQTLAKLHPPVPGTPGKDVYGNPINGRQEKNLKLEYGNNITLSEDKMEIYSNVTGHASLVNSKVFVADVFEVPADVDNATGNIVYDGNVAIKGNVKSGFSVRAKGDIVIDGVVEAAFLSAGGQIIVKRGINGMGKGKVEAKESLISKFIENATVKSGGFIETGCILHSQVSAGADIRVSGKKGFVSGGLLRAGNVIEAQTIGSEMGTITKIEVGVDPSVKERYKEMQESVEEIVKEIERMRPILVNFNERLQKKETVSPERVQQVQQIAKGFREKQSQLKKQKDEMKKLQERIKMSTNAKIKVRGTIYPGVNITISDITLNIKHDRSHARYVKERGEIVARPL